MEHRTLVAYERTDGQYTLHYSHWGTANLKHRITTEMPFGGEDTDSKWTKQILSELADGLEADAVDGYFAEEGQPSPVRSSTPRNRRTVAVAGKPTMPPRVSMRTRTTRTVGTKSG